MYNVIIVFVAAKTAGGFMEELKRIQSELKAPKGQYNSFGKYNYRSCEDILEAVKPLLSKHNAQLTISDDIVLVGDRVYVKATAKLKTEKEEIEVSAFAREAETKKGMDESQVTGTASSYARKYALNGLFLIDDTKDADTNENNRARVESVRQESAASEKFTKEQMDEMKKWNDGTFSTEELARFKAAAKGGNLSEKYSKMKAEYDKRKGDGLTAKDLEGADKAFDIF